MVTTTQIENLVETFPELAATDLNLSKEVYAHFGLLCFNFSLLEHSLINATTVAGAIAKARQHRIKAHSGWMRVYDDSFQHVVKQSFGNLIKLSKKIPEFVDLDGSLNEVKEIRDYFIHHFWRREMALMGNEHGCWRLLVEMNEARQKVEQAEMATRPRHEALLKRIGLPIPTKEYTEREVQLLKAEAHKQLLEGTLKHGIARWREPES